MLFQMEIRSFRYEVRRTLWLCNCSKVSAVLPLLMSLLWLAVKPLKEKDQHNDAFGGSEEGGFREQHLTLKSGLLGPNHKGME